MFYNGLQDFSHIKTESSHIKTESSHIKTESSHIKTESSHTKSILNNILKLVYYYIKLYYIRHNFVYLMAREVITKSNALINASYRLSLTEMQIILYGVSLINPSSKDFPLEYEVEIIRFADIFDRKHSEIYKELKDAVVRRFWEREIRYTNEYGKNVKIRWLTKVEYLDSSGYLSIKFSEELKPYLHQLSQKFTVYYIDQIAKFKSIYSVRFYEFAIMEINKAQLNYHEFIFSLKSIKERLELTTKYKQYFNFKRIVLDRAKAEINEHSDLIIDFEEIKRGRTVESIKFIVRRKEGAKPARYQRVEQEEQTPKPIPKIELPTAEEIEQGMIKESLKSRLINHGVGDKVAHELVNNYSFERIEKALNLIKKDYGYFKLDNPAGYLVAAIKDDFQ